MNQFNPKSIAAPTPVKASLRALPNGKTLEVHFNPASLVYTVENTARQQSADPKRRQFSAQFTGKLTMDLQFDTTDTGADVRKATGEIAKFMKSSADANKKNEKSTNKPAPAVVAFEWGAYVFKGFMESFKETIDFFSADGIPLRALVSIGLARQDEVFDTGSDKQSIVSAVVPTAGGDSVAGSGGPGGGNGNGPGSQDPGPATRGTSATALATQGGDPNASRALASANHLENPRFTGGASLEVSSGIQLNPAVAFVASASVSGGAGFSLGAATGATASLSRSASVGIGANVSSSSGGQVTLGAGGGALFGSTASAGVPASMGAFAGLEAGRTTLSTTAQLDPQRMLAATVGSDVSASSGASFGLGGMALASTGFATDAGASAGARLIFDGD